MATSTAPERYATSLYELATERGELETVKADVESFLNTLKAAPELKSVLASPVIPSTKKLAILKQLYANRLSPILVRFFENVSIRNREALLASVMESFLDVYLSQKGIAKGVVTSATPLSAKAVDSLQTAAEQISGKKVQLAQTIDPALLGGYILRVGDKELDQSVATRLERVRRSLKSAV
jgi:F-type H+-transporting ATPase subunit delta